MLARVKRTTRIMSMRACRSEFPVEQDDRLLFVSLKLFRYFFGLNAVTNHSRRQEKVQMCKFNSCMLEIESLPEEIQILIK